MKLRVSEPGEDGKVSYWMWCPACDDAVRISSDWEWDGNLDAPTFSPSISVTGVQWDTSFKFHKPSHEKIPAGGTIVCHSFLRNGVWEFLEDCTHTMAGQHVPMVDIPTWMESE
jgi:hypothetical protein